jgi:hypothetical protein
MKTFITVRERVNALKNMIREPSAWPGMYEKIAIMSDGAFLCKICVKENFSRILSDTKTEDRFGGWNLDSVIVDCELEPREWIEENPEGYSLDFCAHCNKVLNP